LTVNCIPLLKILARWLKIPSLKEGWVHQAFIMQWVATSCATASGQSTIQQALLCELGASVACKVRPCSCELHIWATHANILKDLKDPLVHFKTMIQSSLSSIHIFLISRAHSLKVRYSSKHGIASQYENPYRCANEMWFKNLCWVGIWFKKLSPISGT
jgi:hypothetical protein